LLLSGLCRRSRFETLNEPGDVVRFTERQKREPDFFDGVKGVDPQQVLLERSFEAFGRANMLFTGNGG
jgi:hypothetical protein